MGFWLEFIGLILLVIIGIGIVIYGTYWSFNVISKFFHVPVNVLIAFLILYLLWIYKSDKKTKK